MTAVMITSLLLMAAAIAIRGIFGRKLSGRLLMLMWAIVFIRLAVPVSIPSSVSVMNLLPSETSVTQEKADVIYPEDVPVTVSRGQNTKTESIPVTSPEKQNTFYGELSDKIAPPPKENPKNKDAEKILLDIYIAVSVILELGVLAAYAVCSVRFSKAEKAEIPEKFAEKNIRFAKCSLGTPAVFGVFRPVILIPEYTDISDNKRLEHIILHEKTHIRHKDQLWSLITLMICCANWFDPLVWVCRILYLKDTEKWCDESVIKIIGRENRKEYADTLLDCAVKQNRPFMLISGFGESNIKQRIKAVMSGKNFKLGASLSVLLLIIAAAVVFGTGKAVRPEVTYQGFVPTEDGWDHIQTLSGSSGEKATVCLNLSRTYGEFSPDNYYCFTISVDSGDYTIASPHAEFTVNGAESFRPLPDGERTDNVSRITYSADFDKETNAVAMAADFGNNTSQTVDAVITYKLKKGSFSAGTYTMNVNYDQTYLSDNSYAEILVSLNHNIEPEGFHAGINGGGYLISCTDGSSDLSIYFSDHEDGATVYKGDNALKLEYFNPYRVTVKSVDVTGDGVKDLVMTTHITGTGVLDNYWNIIDGANLCEIPVDTEVTADIIAGYAQSAVFGDRFGDIDGIELSGDLSSRRMTSDEIFCEKNPHIMGLLFQNTNLNLSDNIRICGGLRIDTENGSIRGTSLFVLVRNEDEYSEFYTADVSYKYEDGIFKPYNIEFDKPEDTGGVPAEIWER